MKNCLLILLLFTATKSNAQTVFAPQNSVWNFYLDGDHVYNNTKFRTEKDTLFMGKMCSKVIGEKKWASGSSSLIAPTYFYTSGDTVLYYHDSLKVFTPWYIFNVKVGDTITLISPPKYIKIDSLFKYVVSKIDTVIIDGLPLRSISTETASYYYPRMGNYTERIGGTMLTGGIIDVLYPTTADHTVGIRCYRDNDIEKKFVADKWDCDYITTRLLEVDLQDQISVYPNPAQQTLFVESQKLKAFLFIQTIAGEIVLQKTIDSGTNSIDISGLAQGVYFLKINSDEHTFIQKLIVVH